MHFIIALSKYYCCVFMRGHRSLLSERYSFATNFDSGGIVVGINVGETLGASVLRSMHALISAQIKAVRKQLLEK